MSITVTLWVAVAVSPPLSVTVQVTVVVPRGKVAGALFVVDAIPQLSAVVGAPRGTPVASQVPGSEFIDTLAGVVIVGCSASVTVTLCVALSVSAAL